jgi:hypothetical protein
MHFLLLLSGSSRPPCNRYSLLAPPAAPHAQLGNFLETLISAPASSHFHGTFQDESNNETGKTR